MTPDPESFRAPFFSKTHLRNEAEQFRAKYAKESVPVDILAIAEFDLGLEFRPVSSLRRDCDAEAAILGDLQTLLVDMDCYMDERFASRLRFSVAHEIGHFVLHKEVFTGLAHQSVDEWIDFTRRLPDEQYSYLEYITPTSLRVDCWFPWNRFVGWSMKRSRRPKNRAFLRKCSGTGVRSTSQGESPNASLFRTRSSRAAFRRKMTSGQPLKPALPRDHPRQPRHGRVGAREEVRAVHAGVAAGVRLG